MKKQKLILYFLFIVSFFFYYNSYWYYTWTWTNVIGTKSVSSTWSFLPHSIDRYSYDYVNNKKRMEFERDDIFTSEVYWVFKSEWKINLYKSGSINTNCSWESVSYYFSWSLINEEWWQWFDIASDENYFCPNSWKFSMKLTSSSTPKFFEDFTISKGDEMTYATIRTTNARWWTTEIDERVIFNDQKIAITWLVNKNVSTESEFDGWTETQSNIANVSWINSKVDWKIWELWEVMWTIKKNMYNLTRWLTWEINTSTPISSLDTKYILYDYSWLQNTDASNQDNKWKILELKNTFDNKKIKVSGEKTLILKWWNLYINSDIYNEDNNSILTIVVLRDENNKKNWWNIYIDPSVTNIDAVLISEWSILNYWWYGGVNKVLNSDDHVNALRKQLMIYGSLITRNSIWDDSSIYWTDHYIKNNWSEANVKIYNLENLRTFQVVRANTIDSWHECYNPLNTGSDITSISWKFDFAWKRECFYTDDAIYWLRPTVSTSPVVLEYNPMVQIKTPDILKK